MEQTFRELVTSGEYRVGKPKRFVQKASIALVILFIVIDYS